jgi:glycerol-3-phosphate dehydrogenase
MSKDYDVIVIGGGIHGAGVAQAVAACNKSVLLLEQSSIASGTSSASSKLIHGGLRYLETAQFSLVRECLTERRLLLQNAPELVKLVPFYFPVYGSTSRSAWQIRAGLSLYALLGGLGKENRFHSLPRQKWNQLDGLEVNGLKSVFQYYDAQTDDAALTRAVIQSAIQLGAEVKQSAKVTNIELNESGSSVSYNELAGDSPTLKKCTARIVVNAAGPWVNHVLACVKPEIPKLDIDLVQGSHIILDHELQHGIYYLESPADQRAVFLMPWKGKAMIGTTESLFAGDPSDVRPLEEEKQYLQETASHYFPHLKNKKVIDAFAGLRVLPVGTGAAFARSRDTILFPDRSGNPRMISIYGGKLTSYRRTAEKLLNTLRSTLSITGNCSQTRTIKLRPAANK